MPEVWGFGAYTPTDFHRAPLPTGARLGASPATPMLGPAFILAWPPSLRPSGSERHLVLPRRSSGLCPFHFDPHVVKESEGLMHVTRVKTLSEGERGVRGERVDLVGEDVGVTCHSRGGKRNTFSTCKAKTADTGPLLEMEAC
ncbi:unnamed protein product [Boreogadus saida]